MKKIIFYMPAIPSRTEEKFEVDDDTSEEEIQELFNDWLGNFDATWYEEE